MTVPAQTVPPELFGCWQRQWIELADGTRDDTSFVVWLQLPSLMADVRLSAAALALGGRSSFSVDELRVLAESDSSSGATECTPVAQRTATAEWSSAIGFQPVSAFPEPGLLEWNSDGTVMTERAASGEYVEEWHLLPESRGALSHSVLADGSEWFRAGSFGVLVRDRRGALPSVSRLTDLADRASLESATDCEFSFAALAGGAWTIQHSTLPWRVGATVDL
ncbi:MAG: hypothetical protein LH616_16420 [Ilumatobacteraceae bacterium]|nr:hypothetical protein [Ilumatobacteraceae bacterium]